MKLLSLKLKNFKGIKSFEVSAPRGESLDIYGDNATGKTTLFDAFCWLLFDKDSIGKKEFEIKTLDKDGEPFHGLDHEVEATLEINGRTKKLQKVYTEKWTKKRGSAGKVFEGNTTDYFVDGVPVKKTEYTAVINQIADEDNFKLLTSPTYFNEHIPAVTGTPSWKRKRNILFEVCGDVPDAEVIASNKKLAKLPDILQGRDSDDYKKIIASQRKKVNEELEKIPVRIDEVNLGLPDISGLNQSEITADIDSYKSLLNAKKENLLQLQSGGEMAQLKTKFTMIEADIRGLRNEHQTSLDSAVADKRTTMNETRVKFDALKFEIRSKENGMAANSEDIEKYKNRANLLRETWKQENAKVFVAPEQETVCPTCGQDIPEEKLEDARAKAESDFNLKKAEKLEKMNMEGKGIMARVNELEKENSDLQKQVKDLKAQQATIDQEVTQLQQEIDSYREDNKLEDSPVYNQKLSEKADIELAIKELGDGNSETIAKAKAEITAIENKISELQRSLDDIKRHEDGQKRIEELKEQEKKLAAEYAKLEEGLFLTEEFIRTKVNMLTEKINSRFKMTRFKLFNTLVNGGVEECCEAMVNTNGSWVPYSTANNAGRINSGLDIINTLSEHYGFTPPIFIDNRESVTELIETKAQTVSLIVSKPDKKLRVEIEPEKSREVA